jgi:hypothetical protein
MAVVGRFIRALKDEYTRRIAVPSRRDGMRRELIFHLGWYNEHRPHEYLDGGTPNEVHHDRPAANLAWRVEPRAAWPVTASCATPHVPVRGAPGEVLRLVVECHGGRRHLPVVRLAVA